MTLLSAAQEVCDVVGVTRPSALISSQEQLARQVLGLAKKTIEELGLMGWPTLNIPYSFPTVNGQAQYDLPADWGSENGDTVFSALQYSQLRGSLSAGDWARQRDTLQTQYGRYRFRIFGLPLKINLSPTPTTVETVTLEYRTTYRVRQADNTYKNTFFADDDVSLFHEELLKKGLEWRLRRAKGMDYSEEFDDYEMSRSQRLGEALQMGSMAVAYRSPFDIPDSLNVFVREGGFGS